MATGIIGPGIEITNKDIKDGRITRFDSSAEDLSDSAMKETQTRIVSSKKIQVPSASLEIGNLDLHESAGRLAIENILNNVFRTVAAGVFDDTGSSKCEYPSQSAVLPFTNQGNDTQNTTVGSTEWIETIVGNIVRSEFTFRGLSNTTGMRLVIREDDAVGDIVFISEEDFVWETGTGFTLNATGDSVLSLASPVILLDGRDYHSKLEVFTGTFTIKGFILAFGGQPSAFVPYHTTRVADGLPQLLMNNGGLVGIVPGTVAINAGTKDVTGTGTNFLSLKDGQNIFIRNEFSVVDVRTSDTVMTLVSNHVEGTTSLGNKVLFEENLMDVSDILNNTKMLMDIDGNLGLGVTASQGRFHLKQLSDAFDKGFTIEGSTGTTGIFYITSSNTAVLQKGSNTNQITLFDNNNIEMLVTPGANIGGFPSGGLRVTSPATSVNSNAVITGHSSFNGNTQLWYFGSTSSSNNNISFINRQNGAMGFSTNDVERLNISNTGSFSTPGDMDLTTGTGGVFKFTDNSLQAGLDAVEYVEMGHGGTNGFINAVGDGGLDFRFEGTTLATFTDFGHLHLMTNVDQKHTLKIITADNLNDTGIAWENSGGSFTGTVFRTDVGSNRADLVFAAGLSSDIDLLTNALIMHGSVAENAKIEIPEAFQLSIGTPAIDDVWTTTDTIGNGVWKTPSGTTLLNQDPLGSSPGSINYDPVKGTMNVRNIFTGSSIQVGQESVVFVINNTGTTITDGEVVHISGYDAANDAMEITLSLADKVEDTEVLGMTTTSMIDGAVGLITIFGRVNDLDTNSFTAGDIVYLSDTVSGGITATRPPIPIQIGHVGKIDASTGFIQIDIRELEKSIFGGYSHSADQTFTANVSAPIAFNTNGEFNGIAHSESVDNDEFTFTSGGVYQATAEPQYTRTTGGGTDVLNMFLAKDTGSGFVNVADSNVKFSVNTALVTTVSPLTATFRVDANDKIRFMVQVEDANLILDAFAASGSAPNDIPATPSIIMNIVRIGD